MIGDKEKEMTRRSSRRVNDSRVCGGGIGGGSEDGNGGGGGNGGFENTELVPLVLRYHVQDMTLNVLVDVCWRQLPRDFHYLLFVKDFVAN